MRKALLKEADDYMELPDSLDGFEEMFIDDYQMGSNGHVFSKY